MGACETSVPWEPWLSTWIRPPCSGHCLPLPTPPPIRYLVSDAQPAGRGYTRAAPLFEQDFTYVCKIGAPLTLGLNTNVCKKKLAAGCCWNKTKGGRGGFGWRLKPTAFSPVSPHLAGQPSAYLHIIPSYDTIYYVMPKSIRSKWISLLTSLTELNEAEIESWAQ